MFTDCLGFVGSSDGKFREKADWRWEIETVGEILEFVKKFLKGRKSENGFRRKIRVSEGFESGKAPLSLGLLGWIYGWKGKRVQRSGKKHRPRTNRNGVRTKGKERVGWI